MFKKFTSILAAFVMAVTIFSITAAPVSAASTVTYQQPIAIDEVGPQEKIGKYYVWVNFYYDDYDGVYYSSINRTINPDTGYGRKCIREITSYSNYIPRSIVSNGYYVYYSVNNDYSGYGTIYRANLKTGGKLKIKEIKNLKEVEGYYNGRIYYTVNKPDYNGVISSIDLRSVSKKTKKTRLEKRYYDPSSSYGRYFTGADIKFAVMNEMHYRYNASTRKSLKLQSAYESVITSTGIYYLKTLDGGYDWVVSKSNWSGKKKKNIKYLYDVDIDYFGKNKMAFMTSDYDCKELIYKTGKVKLIPF